MKFVAGFEFGLLFGPYNQFLGCGVVGKQVGAFADFEVLVSLTFSSASTPQTVKETID
ncbi:MAG: hypothetical protein K2M63_01055 [Muribaculaceae bacterium]|nr:hypothetical protein [Muribaculaceae bacterium]